jgi:glucose/arabinose dehydrogenase
MFTRALCLSLIACPLVAVAQQEKQPKLTTVTGHIFRPVEAEPTDARVSQMKVPDGFHVAKFADKLGKPRMLAVSDAGVVFVSRREQGDVLALIDKNHDGKADETRTAWKLPEAHGLAIHDKKLYVATINEVYAAPIHPDGTLGEPKKILDHLPDAGQHPNRTIGFGPDGQLYVSVGSTANGAYEANQENATLLVAPPDGPGRNVFATGLRNTIGFAWHPVTKQMWGMDHGYDWMGDDIPPEELNKIEQGHFYGWPFLWADNQENPERDPQQYGVGSYEQWKKKATGSVLSYPAHAAPMQMAFYTAEQFPPDYKNDAFIAMHGSWNRQNPKGYEVVRLHFDESGNPKEFSSFLSGFLVDSGTKMIGRPVGVAVAKDGSLLVSDDSGGVIYRISYEKK